MTTRIPAWRRLGLALQSEAQSGVAVTEPTAPHGGENLPVATLDAVKETQKHSETPIDSAQNGKLSKLGKRKHQDETAEQSEQTASKKSRIAAEEGHVQQKNPVHAPVSAQEDRAMSDTAADESTTATPAKGGDPNYRQGKKKKPKLTQKERKKLAQQKTAAPSPTEAVPVRTRATLLASTEVDHSPAPILSTPQKHQPILRDRSKDPSGSPPRTDRRKSVAFTPDTKRVDGDSGQTWFKKWAAEQKGEDVETLAQPSFTSAPATTEEPKETAKVEKNEKKKDKKEKTLAKEREAAAFAAGASAKEEQAAAQQASELTKLSKDNQAGAAGKGKKKDPSVYISYLTQYHSDRDNWKFNKAKQNDVVDNALNIFRIPDEHSGALFEYIKGLKGAGVIERLREKTLAIIEELDAEDAKAPANMDEEAQKAAKEAALQERITKERKRRKVEGDVETLSTHPNGDAYIRRMRRSRAEALLSALGCTAPILPSPKPTNSINPAAQNLAPVQRARKSKRRTDISSDESSSDSSSDESSSDESSESDADDALDSDSESASGNSSSSDSGSSDDSDSGSSSGSDSDSD